MAETSPAELIKTARNQEVTVQSLQEAGPLQRFWDLNRGPLPDGKTHMVRPLDDTEIPWTALVVGLWIPNFFYWGFNQYITQRTLGSKSLAEGQRGIVFAAFLKLMIPFIVVIPGILAFNLFNADLKDDAVNRNALILAEKSPELYRSLSAGMKPAADWPRNATIVERIDDVAGSGSAAGDAIPLYKFGTGLCRTASARTRRRLWPSTGSSWWASTSPMDALPAAATPAVLAEYSGGFASRGRRAGWHDAWSSRNWWPTTTTTPSPR